MFKKSKPEKTLISIYTTTSFKDFLKKLSHKYGYNSLSAFILSLINKSLEDLKEEW